MFGPIDAAMRIYSEKIKKFDRDKSLKLQEDSKLAEVNRLLAERRAREKLESKAKKAADNGQQEKAELLREKASNVIVMPQFPANAVALKKLVWKVRVTNTLKACQSIAEGLVPFTVVEFKQSPLNSFAKDFQGKKKIPGFEFYQDVNGRV